MRKNNYTKNQLPLSKLNSKKNIKKIQQVDYPQIKFKSTIKTFSTKHSISGKAAQNYDSLSNV